MNYLVTGMFTYDMGDRLWVFFSTISANLEPDGWGTKYPVLLKSLCDKGVVEVSSLDDLKKELESVYQEFERRDLLKDFKRIDMDVDLVKLLLKVVDIAEEDSTPVEIRDDEYAKEWIVA